jgi:histone H3/H4
MVKSVRKVAAKMNRRRQGRSIPEGINKPVIKRLARREGLKRMSHYIKNTQNLERWERFREHDTQYELGG